MSNPNKCWGVRLNEGHSPANLKTLYFSAFCVISLAVAANVLQPYILTTFLELRASQHGTASGLIMLAAETTILLTVGAWGVLSDKTGRRAIYVIGILIMALGFGLTPLSRSLGALVGMRCIYTAGISAATGMFATVVADYVVNEDRGKANAFIGVMSGLGASLGAMFVGRLPQIYAEKLGQDGQTAGWSAYMTVVGICVVTAIVLRLGLKGGVAHGVSKRVPFVQVAKEGIEAAKRDMGVTLAYTAAFVTRADLLVASVFFPLWMSKHYQETIQGERTLDAIDQACQQGVAAGGMLMGIVGGGGLLIAPFLGIMADRINRVSALMVGLLLNVIGYGLVFFVDDPTGVFIKIAAVTVGFGQVGGTITAQVLIQQHAIPKFRGSIIGLFSVCGAAGIMVTVFIGGKLFDAVSPNAAFLLLSGFNLAVLILAIILKPKITPPDFGDDDGGAFAAH